MRRYIIQSRQVDPDGTPLLGLSRPVADPRVGMVRALEAAALVRDALQDARVARSSGARCSVCGPLDRVACVRCGRALAAGDEVRHVPTSGRHIIHCCAACEAAYLRTLDAVRRLFGPQGGRHE